jgi:hypothetical protein
MGAAVEKALKMAKEYKPGFLYIRSDELKQEIAWSKKTGKVFCEDFVYGTERHVVYNPEELRILDDAGLKIDIGTHTVKKIFDGEIVKIERAGTDNMGKHPEGQGAENVSDGTNTSTAVGSPAGNSPASKDGELDIY